MDLLASTSNARCCRFFSVNRQDKQAMILDTLRQHWIFGWMYAFPPPHLILQMLAKLASRCSDVAIDNPLIARPSLSGGDSCVVLSQAGAPPSPHSEAAVHQAAHISPVHGMDFTRQCICKAGIPEEITWFNIGSIRQASHRT